MSSLLPAVAGRRLAEGAGTVAARAGQVGAALPVAGRWRVAGGLADRRAQVARNLQRVVGPSLRGAALDRQVDAVFASYARYWAESLRLPGVGLPDLDAGMSLRGFSHLYDALALGRGAILALPHLGGWEWGGMWLARSGTPVSVVVEALDPPEVLEWFVAFRRRLGMEVIVNGPAAAAACLRALRAGRVLCLLSDRVVGSTLGVEVDFFGETTSLPAGAVTLGLRTGTPVLPAAVYFTEAATGHLAVIRPPLDLVRSGRGLRAHVRRTAQVMASELEALIRRHPTQWHLLTPNWPSDRHPGRG